MRFSKILLMTCTLFAFPAKAEIYQWGNPNVTLSMTFPDDWRRTSGQQPGDMVTVVAPGDNDLASCRLRVSEDRRSVIFPREFANTVQHINYSRDYWDAYIGEYRAAMVNGYADDAGLGRGFATWADVSFISPAGTKAQMRGMVYATVYNDTAYVFECSAEASAYPKWYNRFLSVLKSVEMRPEYAKNVNGYYRKFQNDGKLLIHGEKNTDLFVY
jgi:hypothetical protein